jgi:hypothetical protein
VTCLYVTTGGPLDADTARCAEKAMALAKSTKGLVLPPSGALSEQQRKIAVDMFQQSAHITWATAMLLAGHTHRLLGELDGAFGCVSDYGDVRVLGSSLNPRTQTLTTDLMFDSVVSWPRPGAKAASAAALLGLRGRLEGDVEGAVLSAIAKAAGKAAAYRRTSVRDVFRAARAAGIEAYAITPKRAKRLGAIPVSDTVRRIVVERLASGSVVLIPARPVKVGGREAIAWYEVDPATGQQAAVFQDGRHQAVVEFKDLWDAVVSTAEAYVGAFMGSYTGTLWTYASTVLQLISADPEQSWNTVRWNAIEAAAGDPSSTAMFQQAYGDLVGQALSDDMLLSPYAILMGQKGMQDGQTAAVMFLKAVAPKAP